MNLALSTTAGQVDRAVRAMGRIDRNRGVDEGSRPPVESTGRWKWNADGSLSVSLTLSLLDGARFLAGAVRAEYERPRTCDDPDLPGAVSVPRNTESGSVPEDSEVVPSRRRDRCCQMPGCGRTRHLHAHHVTFWSAGGRTDPDNLILLCGSCHRSLHRGEYSITAHGRQSFTFHRPDGAEIEAAPRTSKPTEWQPNPRISINATVPVGGGRMDLGYTTEVLYAVWEWKESSGSRSTPVERAVA